MAEKQMGNVCLQWQIEDRGRFGDGISRARPGAKTRPYSLIVRIDGNRPMKVTLAAPDKRSALRYAKNRWPGAAVEVA